MQTTPPARRRFAVALVVTLVAFGGLATLARQSSAESGTTDVREIAIVYRAHDGRQSHAIVLLPASYDGDVPLPLVISPHGRGEDGAANARLWGDLPALGGFAIVNPDGMGSHLDGRYSWGAPAQIADLAHMPGIVQAALPWLRIDPHRVYAVGGSMGGQETLLLVALHPELLAGAVAVDPVADFSRQYRNFGQRPGGKALQRLARSEVGGTPATFPAAFAARSPLALAGSIAASRMPLEIWWTRTDRIVPQSRLQAGLLVRRLRELDPREPLRVVVGTWRHSAVLRWDRELPTMLVDLGLLPPQAR